MLFRHCCQRMGARLRAGSIVVQRGRCAVSLSIARGLVRFRTRADKLRLWPVMACPLMTLREHADPQAHHADMRLEPNPEAA